MEYKAFAMAYGNGKTKGLEKRMVDLGRSLPCRDLLDIRSRFIDAVREIGRSAWPVSILDPVSNAKDLDLVMTAVQAGLKGRLNAVWAEKARLVAKAAISEQWRRAQKTLFGKFKHIAAYGDFPLKDGSKRLINLPEEWSALLSKADVEALRSFAAGFNFTGAMEMFRRLKAKSAVSGLTHLQVDALRAILQSVEERFGFPEWRSDEAVVQLHLDARCFSGGKAAMDALLERLGDKASTGSLSFWISGVVAHSAPIKLTGRRISAAIEKLDADGLDAENQPRFTSLVVEISPKQAIVKGVLSVKPQPYSIADAVYVIGEDFGYVNTVAWAAHRIDCPIDPGFFETAADWTKDEARAYLSSHFHAGEPELEFLHDGRDFLKRIARHASHIDHLRSEIDLIYNRIGRIKHEICRILGLNSHEVCVDLEMRTEDARLGKLVKKLGGLLAFVAHLKDLRRKAYRSISGVKKSWFGWLANRRVELAVELKAVFVREDLMVVAPEKEKPEYKGRTFAKMINNGSKGQYARCAGSKSRWFGIPEEMVPSYYTSTSDVRFAIVDKEQRKGEKFTAITDGRVWHADVHAASTIALYALLRPKMESLTSM